MGGPEVGDQTAGDAQETHGCKQKVRSHLRPQAAGGTGGVPPPPVPAGGGALLLSPEHMTAAKTQHCPYLTGRQPESYHFFRMAWLPFQWDGSVPPK